MLASTRLWSCHIPESSSSLQIVCCYEAVSQVSVTGSYSSPIQSNSHHQNLVLITSWSVKLHGGLFKFLKGQNCLEKVQPDSWVNYLVITVFRSQHLSFMLWIRIYLNIISQFGLFLWGFWCAYLVWMLQFPMHVTCISVCRYSLICKGNLCHENCS
jgi:hypothetical protein